VALTAAGTLALAGCSQISDQLGGSSGSPDAEPVATSPILVTKHWAVNDGMLSVVVQNTSDRTLRYADGVITARSDDNELLALSADGSDRGCCGVVDLPPGGDFGFYLDVEGGDRISRVEVSYRNVSWDVADQAADTTAVSTVSARPVRVERDGRTTVVLADLRATRGVRQVVAQAFLTSADGDFLAVISGRWQCLVPGTRRIQMQLFHPIPAGAKVERIVVHPVLDDPTQGEPSCDAGSRPL
jgi:hypothetical protein